MAHHRNAGRQDAFDAFLHFASALEFHRVGAAFLHDADGAVEGFLGVSLVGAEGEVHHDQRALGGAHHGLGVVNHLVQGDGQRGLVTRHHIRGAVAHQDDVHARLVHHGGHGVVVRGEHGDFLAALLHFVDHLGGDALGFFVHRHGAKVTLRPNVGT